ncbi:ash family protein [Frederiksenia canicola]|uniref:Ash family protein n=1 Tax=Frederiksenia canicola TaxID=123824 RepID=A0AAE7C1Q7_9PAST|nr:ash family protein [Frederiksenia canicola]QIM64304.1 hypothetical protein A4G17_01955 [Frederiksenia canicola]RPE93849.1 Ash family protein [Frederiksenia canicola]
MSKKEMRKHISKFNSKINNYEFFSLHKSTEQGYIAPAFAKSEAERGNSNYLSVANNSAPCAFFVRSLRTPQERLELHESQERHSMVGRNGQRSIVGCFPQMTVFHPVTLYRQAWKLAVDSQKSICGVTPMIYLLKCVNRYAHAYQENIVKVQAPSADEARWQLSAQYRLLHIVAQFPDRLSDYAEQKFAKLSQNLTACNAKPRPTLGKVCGTAVHPTNTISFQVQGGIYA